MQVFDVTGKYRVIRQTTAPEDMHHIHNGKPMFDFPEDFTVRVIARDIQEAFDKTINTIRSTALDRYRLRDDRKNIGCLTVTNHIGSPVVDEVQPGNIKDVEIHEIHFVSPRTKVIF